MRLLSSYLVLMVATATQAQVTMGNAFKLDGLDDRAVIANGGIFLESPAFTFECWVQRDQAVSPGGRNRILMAKQNNGWGVYYEAGNTIRLTCTGISDVSSSVPINDTLWHHVAVSHDGSTARFYLDGAPTDSIAYAVVFNSGGGDYAIGDREGFGELFTGGMDELRVWSTVRSAMEIATYYCGEIDPASSGLALYYRMNDAPGSAAFTDLSAGGHAAVLQNTNTSANIVPSTVPCAASGIAQPGEAVSLRFHPNPCTPQGATVELPAVRNGNQWNLTLRNASGSIVWQGSGQAGTAQRLVWPALGSGLYLLEAICGMERAMVPVVLE
jgi:hypothetical protein